MTGMQQRPTMRDVADRASVSLKTVSRVVNGESGVSDELVSRVEQAVAAMGYRPDEHARRLRQSGTRTGAIGFVLVDVSNPFFSSILRGIEEVASAHDSIVMSGSTDGDQERENQLVEAFVSRRVDGLIVVPEGSNEGTLRAEVERGTPVVFVDLEPSELTGDLVRSDHMRGSVIATEHLIKHGHRDIAFFGDYPRISSSRLRRDGYEQALQAAGFPIDEHRIVQDRLRPDEWREVIRSYLQQPDRPTAIFSAQNLVSIGCTQALHDLDLHTTIAQVGFDEIELGDVVTPGITTVPQQPLELGRCAAETLFDRIAGTRGPATKEIIASAIIERGSGELPPHPPQRETQ
jgi:LacI family transcriptional regulator